MKLLVLSALISFFIVFVPSSFAYAGVVSWFSKNASLNLQYAGFAGDASIGLTLHWTEKFHTDFLYGQSKIEQDSPVEQISSKIVYSPWIYSINNQILWKIFYTGLLITYTNDNRFFVKSPSPFPEDNYYENNALRSGLVLGTSWVLKPSKFRQFEVYTEVVSLDSLLVAYYNNPEYFKLNDLFGAGIGFKIHF